MKRNVVLVDTEVSPFGKHQGHTAVACAVQALVTLLRRRDPSELQHVGLLVMGSSRIARSDDRHNGVAQSIADAAGLSAVQGGLDLREFCTSGNLAFYEAVLAIESGRIDGAIAVGVDHVTSWRTEGPMSPESVGKWSELGYSPPVLYGLAANRYLHETDATARDLAQVTVRNRQHAVGNPRAMFRSAVSIEEVLESRVIVPPLTKLQCCPPSDGAGVALLMADDVLPRTGTTPRVAVSGMSRVNGRGRDRASLTSFPEDAEAGRMAFAEAEIAPGDVDVVEVHDAFTISQIIHLEDLGLAPRGEGWRLAWQEDGMIVNPSGGLLSRGHPMGATGLAQIDSIRRSLLGGDRDGAARRVGVVQEAGGLQVLGQVMSTCLVMRRVEDRRGNGGPP